MSARRIDFCFDFISPYAYLGWTQIHALAARHDAEVRAVPVLFAALLNAHGHKGPAEIPPKRIYIFKDCLRRAAAYDVPLRPPPSHPFNPLLALRAVQAADGHAGLVSELYARTWGDGAPRGVDRPEVVAAAADAAGLDGAAILERAQSPEVKAALRERTERAVEQGLFGVPTMIVEGEPFWGTDSFAFLEQHLRGEDPVDPERLAAMGDIPASAQR